MNLRSRARSWWRASLPQTNPMFNSFQTEAVVQTLQSGTVADDFIHKCLFKMYLTNASGNPLEVHTEIGGADTSLTRVQKNEDKQRQDGQVELNEKVLARILYQRERKRSIRKGSLVNVILKDERSFQTLPKRRDSLSARSRRFYSLPVCASSRSLRRRREK